MSSPESDKEVNQNLRRQDTDSNLRRQAAAYALQQYSVLALHSIRDGQVNCFNCYCNRPTSIEMLVIRDQRKRDLK